MRYTTIAESCELHARIGWQGLTKKEYLDEGDYYLVTGVDFEGNHVAFERCHYVTKERYDQDSHIQLRVDDVLVTKDGTIGKVAIIDRPLLKPTTLNSGVFVVRPLNTSTLLPGYLMCVLTSALFKRFIERIKVGCTVPHLNQEKFYDFEFPLPVIEQQKKIVELFSALHEAQDCRVMQIELHDKLIESYFYHVFGNPMENPYGWPIVNISEVIGGKISNGFFAKRNAYHANGNVSVLGVANVVNRMYSSIDNLPSTDGTENDIKKYGVKYGDLLFCRSSLVAAGIGKASIVPKNVPDNVLFECHVIRFPLDEVKCVPEFIQVLTTTDFFRNQILSQSKTATMTTISQDGILHSNIILPPIEQQLLFRKFVEEIMDSKTIIQKILERLILLEESLLQKYIG